MGVSAVTFLLIPLTATVIGDGFWTIFALRLICGFGEGLIVPSIQQFIANYANESEKSFAITLALSGMNSGTIFAVAVTPMLINFFDWRG